MKISDRKTIPLILWIIVAVFSITVPQVPPSNAVVPVAVLTGVVVDSGVDTDEDGAFDFLELGVEVNVTEAATYTLQADGLLTSDSEYISVSDSFWGHLDVGVQLVTLRFTGSTIYASGLNPINVSWLSLTDENEESLGELSEVPLSREYLYTEFDAPLQPPQIMVGVRVGD